MIIKKKNILIFITKLEDSNKKNLSIIKTMANIILMVLDL